MQVAEIPILNSNADLTQILPIQQKRTVAFLNHFLMKTVSSLNNFAQSCESRLMEFEYKVQKIEASLLVLESQLSSISGLNDLEIPSPSVTNTREVDLSDTEQMQNVSKHELEEKCTETILNTMEYEGVNACNDPRFNKFFKMLQFGVPEPAVKLKMQYEGLDPNILE